MILHESQYYGIQIFGDTLEHHGVKGQKWGVRRFQNEDGSYTAAGKANRKEEYQSLRKRRRERSKAHRKETAAFRKELRQRKKQRRDAARKETAAFRKELRQRKKERRDAENKAIREFRKRTRPQRLAQYGLIAGIVVANALSKKVIQKLSMASLRKSLKNRDPFEGYRVERISRNSLNMKNLTMDDLRKLDLY